MSDTKLLTDLKAVFYVCKWIGIYPYKNTFLLCKILRNRSTTALISITILITSLRLYHVTNMPGYKNLSLIATLPRVIVDSSILLAHARAMIIHERKMTILGYRLRMFGQDLDRPLTYHKVLMALCIGLQVILPLTVVVTDSTEYAVWFFTLLPVNLIIFCIVMTFSIILEVYQLRLQELFEKVDNGRDGVAINDALEIIAASKEVNDVFGLQILFLTIMVYVDCLFYSSAIVKLINHKDLGSVVHMVFRSSSYLFCSLLELFLVTRACHGVTELFEKFNFHLFQRLRQEKRLSSNNFILLYVAKKPNVYFTACQLFSLDHTLMTKVFNVALTFLVIFVQVNRQYFVIEI